MAAKQGRAAALSPAFSLPVTFWCRSLSPLNARMAPVDAREGDLSRPSRAVTLRRGEPTRARGGLARRTTQRRLESHCRAISTQYRSRTALEPVARPDAPDRPVEQASRRETGVESPPG